MLRSCLSIHCGLCKELPRCLDVCIPGGLVLITGTDGSCLKPCVSCNDSRVSLIISPTETSLHSLITSSHRPTDSLHIHCCSLAPLTSDQTYITHLNYIQILSQGMIAFSRTDSDSISFMLGNCLYTKKKAKSFLMLIILFKQNI